MSDEGKLQVSELDFADIKQALKQFMEADPTFSDFDFDGSGLNALLSVMAYNTHYNAIFANMIFNEAFLDTAVKRDSVVSHAKTLNYVPRSIQAPKATLDVSIFTTNVLTQINIPKGTKFTTSIDGKSFTFINREDSIATLSTTPNVYTAVDVELFEGRILNFSYIVDSSDADQRFLIPQKDVDISTLKVIIQNSTVDTTVRTFIKADDITNVKSTDKVYFIQESEDGKFELKFGDDVVGVKPADGNLIILEYIATKGDVANKASSFTPASNISGFTNITLVTKQAATGGARAESLDSIKLLAPRFFQTQNRSVTARDYKTLLLTNTTVITPNFSSVAVWGGEDNDPPIYGKVFISLKPKSGDTISAFLKDQIITDILNPINVISITPEIVDPEFLNVIVEVTSSYNPDDTVKSATTLKNEIITAIKSFNTTTLEFFDEKFRYSKFLTLVDNVDVSITNNLTVIKLRKAFNPTLNTPLKYTVKFENALQAGTLSSTKFIIADPDQNSTDVYSIIDDSNGKLQIIKTKSDNTIVTFDSDFGTIDYTTGKIETDTFTPTSLINSTEISLTATPSKRDVNSVRNLILQIEDLDITVTMVKNNKPTGS